MTKIANTVLDTNVLRSAAEGSVWASGVMDAMREGQIHLIYSAKCWYELNDVLFRPEADHIPPESKDRLLRLIDRYGDLRRDPPLAGLTPVTFDPKDNYLIELARSTGSVLITDDGAVLHSGRTVMIDFQGRPITDERNPTLKPGSGERIQHYVPMLSLRTAYEELQATSALQTALADASGAPHLLLL